VVEHEYQADGNPVTSGPGFAVTWHPSALSLGRVSRLVAADVNPAVRGTDFPGADAAFDQTVSRVGEKPSLSRDVGGSPPFRSARDK
jgi:hypothetical protein